MLYQLVYILIVKWYKSTITLHIKTYRALISYVHLEYTVNSEFSQPASHFISGIWANYVEDLIHMQLLEYRPKIKRDRDIANRERQKEIGINRENGRRDRRTKRV